MSVRKMESGGYEVRYDTYDVSGERHQHKKRFKAGQSKDAREFDAAHTLDRTHESDITVGEFMNTWLDHAKQHCRITTYGNYKRFVELYFYKAFDANMDKWRINIRKTKLVKIQKRHIQMFIDWMISEQYSYATVKSAMNGIRVAFLYAASDAMQLIAKNPVSGIVLGGGESHAGQVYNADMIKKMLLDLRGHDLFMYVFLAANLGMCRGEVGGLRWKDVDLEAGKLSIAQARVDTAIDGVHESAPKTKNRKRTIKLPPYIVQELKEEKRRQKEQQLLFGSRYVKSEYVCRRADGRLYCPTDISRTFHRFLVRNKYSPIRFHDLRHSCASILLSENVPLTVVSAILGHANPQITSSVYAHMLDNGKQVAADALEKIYATQESVKNVSRSEK